MLNIVQLHHFVLVAREGSFAKAADLACITQPALSNSLRALESRVGFRLIERSERPVRVTPQGERFLIRAERILFESRNLDRELQHLANGTGGRIRFGLPAIFSTSLGGIIVAEWHKMYPEVKLEVVVRHAYELSELLLEEKLDVTVLDESTLPPENSVDVTALPPLRGGAFCRADHPILSIPNLEPRHLQDYKLAGTFFPENSLYRIRSFIGLDDMSAEVITVDCHNVAMLRDLAELSDVILLTTPGCVRNALKHGELQEVPLEFGIAGEWSIASIRGHVAHPAVPDLIAKTIEVAQRERDATMAPPRARTQAAGI